MHIMSMLGTSVGMDHTASACMHVSWFLEVSFKMKVLLYIYNIIYISYIYLYMYYIHYVYIYTVLYFIIEKNNQNTT